MVVAPPLMAVRRDWTVVLAAVVKVTVLAVPSLTVMTSVARKPKEESSVVAVIAAPDIDVAVPVTMAVVAELASAWASEPWALWMRLVSWVMPLLVASIVRCPMVMLSTIVLRRLILVWNE